MALQAPPPHPRPPDPPENNPSLLPSKSSKQLPQHQPTIPIIDDTSEEGTNVASSLPPPATANSEPNHAIPIRAIDSMPPKTLNPQFSPNSINPISSSDDPKKCGEVDVGTNGAPVKTSILTHPDSVHSYRDTQFPKLTANYDRPNKAHRLNSQLLTKTHPPSVRSNATQTVEPINTTHNTQPVTLTIQQLNAKFNHNVPNQQPTQIPNIRAPLPPNVLPSYATRLRATQTYEDPQVDITDPLITTKQGLPAVLFDRNDFMVKLASKCRHTLIGKFSTTMPKMDVIRKSLTSQLQIKGSCKVTHFNSTHVYIDLDNEIDHAIVWNKEKIYVDGRLMRLLVWTPTFTPEEETPIAPVWVVLPQLPWHCYTMKFVSKLLEPVGRVLFFDAASIQRTRGSVAKVKIEIDITKPRPPHIWLGFPREVGDIYGEGRWQELQFEHIPDYCNHCKHQGHCQSQCRVKHREEEYQKRKKDQEDRQREHGQNVNGNTNTVHHSKYQEQVPNQPIQISITDKGQCRQALHVQTQDPKQTSTWQVQRKKNFKGTKNQQQVAHHAHQPLHQQPIAQQQPVQQSADVAATIIVENMKQQHDNVSGIVHEPVVTVVSAATAGVPASAGEIEDSLLGTNDTVHAKLGVPDAVNAPNTWSLGTSPVQDKTLTTVNGTVITPTATGNASLDLQEDFNFANSLALIPTNAVLSVNSLPKAGAKGELSTVASGSNQLPSGVCQRVLVKRAQVADTEVKDTGTVQKDATAGEMENAVTVYDAVPLLVVQPPTVTGATGQVVDALPHAAETTKNWVNRAFGKIGFATKWDEEHPKTECTHNRKPLSIHDKLKQYAGYEREPEVFFLGDMFNESLEGNALTPTQQLEFMCNEASKVIKVAGQSNWNLNAQPFTPNAIPPQGIVVATEKAEPKEVATESAPVQPKRVQPSRTSRSKPYRGKG